MAVGALLVTQFLAALLRVLLAGWLLWLDFDRRVNRAFALFLVLRALVTVSNRMTSISSDPGYWERVVGYFAIATGPVLLAFLVVYATPRPTLGSRLAVWGIIAGTTLAEVAYAVDHCLDMCRLADGRLRLGPLTLLSFNLPVFMAGAGAYLAWERRALAPGPRRSAAFLVALAFLLNGILDASVTLGYLAAPAGGLAALLSLYDGAWFVAPLALLHTLALPVGLAGVVALLSEQTSARARRVAAGAAALSLLTGMFLGAGLEPRLRGVLLFVIGLWRLLLPALVVYALLRHRLFDLDVRVRWTISKGTIAFAVLAAFFLVEQVVQDVVSDQFGVLAGLAAAALLVLAQRPIGEVGHRLADLLLPDEKPSAARGREERIALYRAHALDAWAEGALHRSARALLDELRARLDLTFEECAVIEREAALGT